MRWRLLALVVPALVALAYAGPVQAAGGAGADQAQAPASEIQLAMTLYAGGITLGKVDMDATLRGGAYHLASNLETSGVVNAFWQAQIQATASGTLLGKTLEPGLYDSFTVQHSGKRQEVSLDYAAGTAPRLFADPAYSTTGYEVPADQQKATLDPLSAVMFILSGIGGQAGNPCALTAPVFDGRRRYDIEMTKVKDLDIKMDNGLYAGHALLCRIKYHQLAGFSPNVMYHREAFPMVNAWVATFPSAVAGHDYAVPLRVWADTGYGVVAAVADRLRIDGQAPKGISGG